jgi:hypothetical protein
MVKLLTQFWHVSPRIEATAQTRSERELQYPMISPSPSENPEEDFPNTIRAPEQS